MKHPSSIVFDDLGRIESTSPTFGVGSDRKEPDAETASFVSRPPSRTVLERDAVDASNRFTKAVTLLLFCMSILGMRPFSVCFRRSKTSDCPGNHSKFTTYSIVGSVVWACACLTQTFMIMRMFSPLVLCTKRFGFFHMKTIVYAQQFALHLFAISLLCILMRNAATIHKLFHKLNRIELPQAEFEKFRRRALLFTCAAIIKCLLVEFIFFWYALRNADEQPGFNLGMRLSFTLDICFVMAAITLPTALFVLVCHFVVVAFRDNRHKFAALAEISVEHLRVCYQDYLQLAQLTEDVSKCFEDFMFVTILFLIPVICTTALNFTRFGSFVVIIITFFVAAICTFVLVMYHGIWLNEQILSAMITFVALWAQLSTNAEVCNNGGMLIWNETSIVNNMFMMSLFVH